MGKEEGCDLLPLLWSERVAQLGHHGRVAPDGLLPGDAGVGEVPAKCLHVQGNRQ